MYIERRTDDQGRGLVQGLAARDVGGVTVCYTLLLIK